MTEAEIRAALLSLRPQSETATPCHWYVTEKEVEGSAGVSGYESYEIEAHAGPDGRRVSLFDAINSDVARVERDRSGHSAHQWDAVAKANLDYVAALVNWHRAFLQQEAEKAHINHMLALSKPIAYMVDCGNATNAQGDVRLWTAQREREARGCAEAFGVPLMPLYRHPAVDAVQWHTLDDCPSDAEDIWGWGPHLTRAVKMQAHGEYWRIQRDKNVIGVTHWAPLVRPDLPSAASPSCPRCASLPAMRSAIEGMVALWKDVETTDLPEDVLLALAKANGALRACARIASGGHSDPRGEE